MHERKVSEKSAKECKCKNMNCGQLARVGSLGRMRTLELSTRSKKFKQVSQWRRDKTRAHSQLDAQSQNDRGSNPGIVSLFRDEDSNSQG